MTCLSRFKSVRSPCGRSTSHLTLRGSHLKFVKRHTTPIPLVVVPVYCVGRIQDSRLIDDLRRYDIDLFPVVGCRRHRKRTDNLLNEEGVEVFCTRCDILLIPFCFSIVKCNDVTSLLNIQLVTVCRIETKIDYRLFLGRSHQLLLGIDCCTVFGVLSVTEHVISKVVHKETRLGSVHTIRVQCLQRLSLQFQHGQYSHLFDFIQFGFDLIDVRHRVSFQRKDTTLQVFGVKSERIQFKLVQIDTVRRSFGEFRRQ